MIVLKLEDKLNKKTNKNMKANNIFKKITSCSAITMLIVSLASPINLAAAEDDALYQLYLEQAKEYEGNDLGEILTTSAKVLEKTGKHSSCPNFTRYIGKTFDSTEAFTMKFKEMMDLVNDECKSYVNKNLSLVGSKLYGPGQIFDSFNASAIAIQKNPDVKFIDFDAPQEEEMVVEVVEPEITPEIIEEEKIPEVKEIIKTPEEPINEPEIVSEVDPGVTPNDTIVDVIDVPTTNNVETPPTENIVIDTPEDNTSIPKEEESTTTQPDEETTLDNYDNNDNGLPDFFEEIYNLPKSEELANLDNDNDGVTNADEYIYGTDPNISDSDGDGISDADEIAGGTNPSDEDSDGDLIPDGEELQNGTDPLNGDSDGNGMSDFVQQNLGIPAGTTITDNNANGVPDVTEDRITKETGIVIENGYQDTDNDGISDAIEALYGTNPSTTNSLDEELSDDEVILDYRNIFSRRRELQARRKRMQERRAKIESGELIISTKKARIINIQDGEVLLDRTPLFKGTAPEGAVVVFYYKDPITGVTIEMGEVIASGGDKFIFEPTDGLALGKHKISVRVYNKDRKATVDNIPSIEIEIADEVEGVDTEVAKAPRIDSINEKNLEADINQAELEKNLELTTEQRAAKVAKLKLQYEKGQKNTIRGYAKPGSIVEVYWQSLIVSSAVLADAGTGYYEVSPGSSDLEPGDHTAWLYSVDPETNIKSQNTKIEFSIGESTEATILKLDGNKNIMLLLIGLLVLVGGVTFIVKRKKKIPTPLS